uniref:Uncharacterized protein n=1 Tax=Oryza punctata TaxID=4537 RepID=A0A0E0JNK1_ORYPU
MTTCRAYASVAIELEMPRLGDRTADSMPKGKSELIYVSSIFTICYMERNYRRQGIGGLPELIEFGVFLIGVVGMVKTVGYFFLDAIDSPNAREDWRDLRL